MISATPAPTPTATTAAIASRSAATRAIRSWPTRPAPPWGFSYGGYSLPQGLGARVTARSARAAWAPRLRPRRGGGAARPRVHARRRLGPPGADANNRGRPRQCQPEGGQQGRQQGARARPQPSDAAGPEGARTPDPGSPAAPAVASRHQAPGVDAADAARSAAARRPAKDKGPTSLGTSAPAAPDGDDPPTPGTTAARCCSSQDPPVSEIQVDLRGWTPVSPQPDPRGARVRGPTSRQRTLPDAVRSTTCRSLPRRHGRGPTCELRSRPTGQPAASPSAATARAVTLRRAGPDFGIRSAMPMSHASSLPRA